VAAAVDQSDGSCHVARVEIAGWHLAARH
jgi:hypothetical protein